MSNAKRGFVELRQILSALSEGVITDEEGRRLEQILQEDPMARGFYRRYVQLHAMLQFEEQPHEIAYEAPGSAEEFLAYVRQASGQDAWHKEHAESSGMGIAAPDTALRPDSFLRASDAGVRARDTRSPALNLGFRTSRFLLPATVALGLMLISAAIGGIVALKMMADEDPGVRQPIARNHSQQDLDSSPQFTGTLVNLTNCRWSPSSRAVDFGDGSEVLVGQTLNLLEGIAAVPISSSCGSSGRFVLEGPVAMAVAGDSLSLLQHGKLFAAIDSKKVPYVLGTPLGQMSICGGASVGVVAANQDVIVHVFAGAVDFELLWPSETEEDRFRVSAGSSLRLAIGKNGELAVQRGKANQLCFVINVPMAESRLVISEDYVSAVRRTNPLAYWRFEGQRNGFVRNEIEDRLHLRIHGTVGWRDYVGNRSIEFGAGRNSGRLFSEDALDGAAIAKEFSLEAWIKASHIHNASIFSLANWSEDGNELSRHLAMLELGGPAGPFSRERANRSPGHPRFYPERLRFLYRSPPGSDGDTGTSAYSKGSYVTRQWQYLVASRQGSDLRLYLNGKLIAKAEDHSEPTFEDMKVLIGQLHPPKNGMSRHRTFVGELDEVAIYGRALSDAEIAEHYVLGSRKPRDIKRSSATNLSARFAPKDNFGGAELPPRAGIPPVLANVILSSPGFSPIVHHGDNAYATFTE